MSSTRSITDRRRGALDREIVLARVFDAEDGTVFTTPTMEKLAHHLGVA